MSNQPQKIKKVPMRRCIGCGQSFLKRDLIRVVRGTDGTVSIDSTGKMNGRGAYLCKKLACFKKAVKQNRLKTNLECDIPEDVVKCLEEQIITLEASNDNLYE